MKHHRIYCFVAFRKTTHVLKSKKGVFDVSSMFTKQHYSMARYFLHTLLLRRHWQQIVQCAGNRL